MSEVTNSPLVIETSEPKEPSLWEKWKLSDGTYAAPEPMRFEELAENVPRGDVLQMAKVTVRYALERAGLLLTPDQLSEPLLKLDSADDLGKARIIDSFLEYCSLADEVWEKIEEASELSSQYSFDQIRLDLPAKTNDAENLAVMKIVKAMHKNKSAAFAQIGNMTKSQSSATLRIMHGWEKGIELPKPGDHLNSVS